MTNPTPSPSQSKSVEREEIAAIIDPGFDRRYSKDRERFAGYLVNEMAYYDALAKADRILSLIGSKTQGGEP